MTIFRYCSADSHRSSSNRVLMLSRSHLIALAYLLSGSGDAIETVFGQSPAAAVANVEKVRADVQAVVEEYYNACQRESLEDLALLWDQQSPHFQARQQSATRLFDSYQSVFEQPEVLTAEEDGDKLRAVISVRWQRRKQQESFEQTQLIRTFLLKTSDRSWKIWDYYPTSKDSADELIQVPREHLPDWLDRHRSMLSGELVKELLERARDLRREGRDTEALSLAELAQQVAEVTAADRDLVQAEWALAVTKEKLGQFEEAIRHYQRSIDLYGKVGDTASVGTAYMSISIINYENLDRIHDAVANAEQYVAISLQRHDAASSAHGLNLLGSMFEQLRDPVAAERNYTLSVEWMKRLQSKDAKLTDDELLEWRLATLGKVAELRMQLRRFDEGVAAARERLQASAAAGLNSQEAAGWKQLGQIAAMRYQWDLARSYYARALAKAREAGNPAELGHILTQLGWYHVNRDELDQAEKHFVESLPHQEAAGNRAQVAYTYTAIAWLHSGQARFESADHNLALAETIMREINDAEGLAQVQMTRAELEFARGNFADSLRIAERCLAQTGDLQSLSPVFLQSMLQFIAMCRFSSGYFDEAERVYRRIIDTLELQGDPIIIGQAHLGLADVYAGQGSLRVAMAHVKHAQASYESAGDGLRAAEALHKLADFAEKFGDVSQASTIYDACLQRYQQLEQKNEQADILKAQGYLYCRKGDFARAQSSFEEARQIYEQQGNLTEAGHAVLGLSIVYTLQNNHRAAADMLARALASGASLRSRAGLELALADSLRALGQYQDALQQVQQCLAALKDDDPNVEWRAHHTAAQCRWALGNAEAALADCERAIECIERMRAHTAGGIFEQRGFFRDNLVPYYTIAEYLVHLKRSAEALSYVERAKARALLDMLQGHQERIGVSLPDPDRETEFRLNNNILRLNLQLRREQVRDSSNAENLNAIKQQLDQARLEYESFQASLFARYPQLRGERGQFAVITPEELSRLLPDSQTALLEFFLGESQALLFVVRASQQAEVQQPLIQAFLLDVTRAECVQLVEQFREAIQDPRADLAGLSTKLYEKLLLPAESVIDSAHTWIIVPDGVLWDVPFAAVAKRPNRFLIEDHALAYGPSLSVLREIRDITRSRAVSSRPRILALGNPALNEVTQSAELAIRGGLAPLPAAEREVQTLAKIYGHENSQVLIGRSATESNLRELATQYDVVHLATHGLFDNANPFYSNLVLAQEDNSEFDGLLEARELLSANWSARLTILSACESALGERHPGEGVIGFSWSLAIAGCPTTVASSWKVEDNATEHLMVHFHRQLLQNESSITKAESLRLAQLALLRGYDPASHSLRGSGKLLTVTEAEKAAAAPSGGRCPPFYWAAFAVIGDWQ